MHGVLALLMVMFLAGQAAAGAWTGNQFIYKPSLGARGETEKNTFDAGLERVDAHLGKYKTLGDPGHATLTEALTTIGSAATTLFIPAGAVNVTANTNIPANVHLKVLRGGLFNISNGVTLTISGPLEAGPYQVFSWSGTGKVILGPGSVKAALPQWWGADHTGVNDCKAAIQAAHDAIRGGPISGAPGGLGGYQGTVYLPKGTYKINSTITWDVGNVALRSDGAYLNATSNTNSAAFHLTSYPPDYLGGGNYAQTRHVGLIEGIFLRGPGKASAGSVGFYISGQDASRTASTFTINRVNLHGFENGIKIFSHAHSIDFNSMYIYRCAIGAHLPDGGTNYGERINFNQTCFAENDLAFKSSNGDADFYFLSCSFDFNKKLARLENSKADLTDCHVEFDSNHASTPMTPPNIYVDGDFGHFYMKGGMYLDITGGTQPTHHAQCDATNPTTTPAAFGMQFEAVRFHNISPTGKYFATGSGQVQFRHTGLYGMYAPVNFLTSAAMNLYNPATGVPELYFITEDTQAITSRTAGQNINLSLSGTYKRTGSQSLKASKTYGAGSVSRFTVIVPAHGPGHLDTRLWYLNPGNKTGSFNLELRAYLIDFEGGLIKIRRDVDMGSRQVNLSSTGPNWQELFETNKPVPAWANFVRISHKLVWG
jgi:hypothetical protein